MKARSQTIIESLETRRLLSGTSLSDAGVLRVWGDDFKSNTITLSNNIDGLNLDVTITSVNRLGVAKTITRSFALTSVGSVVVVGGSKSDTITADDTNSDFTLSMRVAGRGGDDVITTGEGNDLILCGGGNDRVEADSGNDRIFGGLGNDNIDAGGDDDRVSGGWGNDFIEAGGGSDFVRGDAGNDTVEGGGGNDLVYGCGGDDTLYGEKDNDILWGGGGNDILWGGDGDDTLGGVLGTNALRGEAGVDIFVVRKIELNPSNDFDPTFDLKSEVTTNNEGGTPPAV